MRMMRNAEKPRRNKFSPGGGGDLSPIVNLRMLFRVARGFLQGFRGLFSLIFCLPTIIYT